jgi:hypothetical protein
MPNPRQPTEPRLGNRVAEGHGRRERDEMRAQARAHLRGSYDGDPEVDQERLRAKLGAGAQMTGDGRLATWETIARRAHDAQRVRLGGDQADVDYGGFDPDSLEEEIRRDGLASLDRLDGRR